MYTLNCWLLRLLELSCSTAGALAGIHANNFPLTRYLSSGRMTTQITARVCLLYVCACVCLGVLSFACFYGVTIFKKKIIKQLQMCCSLRSHHCQLSVWPGVILSLSLAMSLYHFYCNQQQS